MVKRKRKEFKKKTMNCLFFIGITVDRIYSFLEQCRDERFLICLISLLRNSFSEKDTEALLPMFNSAKLLTVSKNRLNTKDFKQFFWYYRL